MIVVGRFPNSVTDTWSTPYMRSRFVDTDPAEVPEADHPVYGVSIQLAGFHFRSGKLNATNRLGMAVMRP